MHVGYTVCGVKGSLGAIWWTHGQGLQRTTEREKARALMLEQTKHKALIEGAEAAEAKHK